MEVEAVTRLATSDLFDLVQASSATALFLGYSHEARNVIGPEGGGRHHLRFSVAFPE